MSSELHKKAIERITPEERQEMIYRIDNYVDMYNSIESILDRKINDLIASSEEEYHPLEELKKSKEYSACIEAMKEVCGMCDNFHVRIPFSEWIDRQVDDTRKAGDVYESLNDLTKRLISYAVERYIKSILVLKPVTEGLMWDNSKVIDFVNWFLKLHKLSDRYELENLHIIESFQNGDAPEAWHQKML